MRQNRKFPEGVRFKLPGADARLLDRLASCCVVDDEGFFVAVAPLMLKPDVAVIISEDSVELLGRAADGMDVERAPKAEQEEQHEQHEQPEPPRRGRNARRNR